MAGENALKCRDVSTMIKQAFISDKTLPVSRSGTVSMVYSPSSSSPSNTLPLFFSSSTQSQAQNQIQTRPNQAQTPYEMMSEEQHCESKLSDDKHGNLQDQVAKLLDGAPFRDPKWGGLSDVRLTVVSKDGFRVSMSVLAEKSGFFAKKLQRDREVSYSVEISDCDDVEVYVENFHVETGIFLDVRICRGG